MRSVARITLESFDPYLVDEQHRLAIVDRFAEWADIIDPGTSGPFDAPGETVLPSSPEDDNPVAAVEDEWTVSP
jgi:hypothetical protein